MGFGVVAALAVPVLAVAWLWYGLAQFEAQTEQGKALAAGTTMAGFGGLFGGVPLVIAHIVGLAALGVLGWKGYGGRGIVYAIVAVLVATGMCVAAAQLVWAGELFQLGTNNNTFVP